VLNDFFSYPQLKGNAFAAFTKGPLTLRWQIRYAEGTSPAFGSPFFITRPNAGATAACNGTSTSCGGADLVAVGKSKDYWQHDLVVRWEAPWDTIVTASVQNVFDKDPPYVPSPYNYDITQGNPLGRVFEIGFKKSF
jgi:iron complex outermembrane recepter protein